MTLTAPVRTARRTAQRPMRLSLTTPRTRRLVPMVSSLALCAALVPAATAAAPTVNASTPTARLLDSATSGSVALPVDRRGWGSGGTTDDDRSWGSSGQVSATDGTPASSAAGVLLVDTLVSGGQAAGTAMVLSSDGYALTNYHVVEGSTQVRVTVSGTTTSYTASVVGFDKVHDVAVLKLEGAHDLATVSLDTDGVSLGEAVTAVGNGGGEDRLYSVSGTITDTDDSISVADNEWSTRTHALANLLKTDADVVPGYSGGPLFDAQGDVVGLTTAASTGSSIDGYAVRISDAIAIADQIRSGKESGTIHVGPRAALGVQVASDALAVGYDSGFGGAVNQSVPGSGARVAGVVDGGVADDAGLSAGSTITRIDGIDVVSSEALVTALGRFDPGDTVSVTWIDAAGATHSTSLALDRSQVA